MDRTCTACGASLPLNAPFCAQCGQPVEETTQTLGPQHPWYKRAWLWVIVALAAALAAFIILAVLFTANLGSGPLYTTYEEVPLAAHGE